MHWKHSKCVIHDNVTQKLKGNKQFLLVVRETVTNFESVKSSARKSGETRQLGGKQSRTQKSYNHPKTLNPKHYHACPDVVIGPKENGRERETGQALFRKREYC